MIRRLAALLVLALLAVSCTPIASGPLLPRPTPHPDTVTVIYEPEPTTTTVAVASETVDPGPGCPSTFCVIYHVNPQATWSDGDPVTAADFAHTVALGQSGGLAEYAAVSDVDVLDDETLRVGFSKPFGAWQTLFSRVYRSGQAGDLARMDTSGPFRFVEWEEGSHLTLESRTDWWAETDPISGDPLGNVTEVTFVFIESREDMVSALGDGEIDVIAARPDAATVESLAGMENVEYTLAPGPYWEHIDFHHDDPMLAQRWVREAFSLAIDREKILDRTVRLLDPAADPLDNTVWMSDSQYYQSHYPDGFDPTRAERILADNGCSRGADGIQVCGDTRMSFLWGTTNDDSARREIFESVREDLATIGIELRPVFRSPSDFVTRDFLFGGPDVWQLLNFSWRARPEPALANPTYLCDDAGSLNVNRYCSEQVEQLIRRTETVVSPERRAALYNRADRLYLEDLAVIPLYQKPTLIAWTSEIDGPEPNQTTSGDLWNVASWSGKSSIVVALPSEPVDLNPLSWDDDSANVILGALLYGAFGMNPAHEQLPVLVDSVDVIQG